MLVNKFFVFSFVIVMIPKVFCIAPPEQFIDGKRIKSPKSEIVFKKIFEKEHLLLSFINSALKRGSKEKPSFTHVKYLDTSLSPEVPTISFLDVVCETNLNEQIIVEIQFRKDRYFLKRATYYVSRLYSEQLQTTSEMKKIAEDEKKFVDKPQIIYQDAADNNVKTTPELSGLTEDDKVYKQIKPGYFIAICDFVLFENKEYISTHIVKDEKTVKELSWTFIELPKMKEIDAATLSTDVDKFSYLFLFDATKQRYIDGLEFLSKSNRIIKDALDIANVGSWSRVDLQSYQRTQDIVNRIQSEVATAREDGMTEGMRVGEKKGEENGKKKGKDEQRIETALTMLKKNYLCKEIADILGMTEKEVTKLKNQEIKTSN